MAQKTNKLDNMLVHATRYTARQFVERVIKHFPAKDSYELKEENLTFFMAVSSSPGKSASHFLSLFPVMARSSVRVCPISQPAQMPRK